MRRSALVNVGFMLVHTPLVGSAPAVLFITLMDWVLTRNFLRLRLLDDDAASASSKPVVQWLLLDRQWWCRLAFVDAYLLCWDTAIRPWAPSLP